MLLSVIIPTCNRNHLLRECLDRLHPDVQQTDGFKYEVIITDDGRVSNAKKLINNEYSWAYWTKGPALGPAANRNNGAKRAEGEWLVFLDDDCLPDTDILLAYAKLIKSNPEVKVIEGLIYSDDYIPPLFIAPINLTGGYLWSCNFAINRKVFGKMKGFDTNYKYPNMEDNDLNKRIRIAGYKILFNKDAKVYHPPRPVATPKKLALYHESWMYYYSKFGPRKTLGNLLVTIFKVRLRGILKGPKNKASVKAFFALFAEVYYTIGYSRKWDIK